MTPVVAGACIVGGLIGFAATAFFVLNSVFATEAANTIAAMASSIVGSMLFLSPFVAGVSVNSLSLTDYNIMRIRSIIENNRSK